MLFLRLLDGQNWAKNWQNYLTVWTRDYRLGHHTNLLELILHWQPHVIWYQDTDCESHYRTILLCLSHHTFSPNWIIQPPICLPKPYRLQPDRTLSTERLSSQRFSVWMTYTCLKTTPQLASNRTKRAVLMLTVTELLQVSSHRRVRGRKPGRQRLLKKGCMKYLIFYCYRLWSNYYGY